jgi:hypothetical protein
MNIVVEWLALLFQEVMGSNLGVKTGYSDRFFVVFLSSLRQMPR